MVLRWYFDGRYLQVLVRDVGLDYGHKVFEIMFLIQVFTLRVCVCVCVCVCACVRACLQPNWRQP